MAASEETKNAVPIVATILSILLVILVVSAVIIWINRTKDNVDGQFDMLEQYQDTVQSQIGDLLN